MHSLGNLHIRNSNYSEALKCYENTVLARAKLLGLEHPAVANTLFKMAGIIGNAMEYAKANAMYTAGVLFCYIPSLFKVL